MEDKLTILRLASPVETPRQDPRPLAEFIIGLLHLLKTIASESKARHGDQYLHRLDHYASVVANEVDALPLQRADQGCLKETAEFFKAWQQQVADGEQELRNLIDLLTATIRSLSADNQSFHAQASATTRRLQDYCELEDICELKAKVTQEVAQFTEAIDRKQREEAAQLAALSRRVTTLQSELREAEQKARLDGLTGLDNRTSFDEKIGELVGKAEPFVLTLLDIDGFKQINDTYGHQAGDQVLVSAAAMLRRLSRATDFLSRYGGEEFALFHLGSSIKHSLPRISQLLKEIAAASHECMVAGRRLGIRFTLSAGLTEFAIGDTAESVIARADSSLYEAKHQGKNRALALKRF